MKKCPYCDTSNFDNATFCENCGMPLKPGMKISCPRCGKLVREHDKYCKACGAYLLEDKVCPSCGSRVLSTDAFCAQCGAVLSEGGSVSEQNIISREETPLMSDEIQENIHEDIMEEEDVDDDLESVAESILNSASVAEEESIESEVVEETPVPAEVTGDGAMAVEAEINNYLMEGGSFMAEEKYGDAIKSFSKAIGTLIKNGLDKEEDRRLITLYLRRGEAFKLTGDMDRAVDNYSRALKYAQSIFAVSEVERIKNLIAGM